MIAGIDEAGRGPLVGPVVAAAVVINAPLPIIVKDSKLLSEKKRADYAEIIKLHCTYAIGIASSKEIDELNILQASLLAMSRAYHSLKVRPEKVLVDGNKGPNLPCQVECIIKGDLTIPAISAASILAKVTRDAIMDEYHALYPQYEFNRHKGYPTKAHLHALNEHGVIPDIYRLTYKPVKRIIEAEDANA